MFHRTFSFAAAALLVCGAAHAATTAGAVQQIVVASSPGTQQTTTTCSTGFVKIPGVAAVITIPPGADQLLVARFNALMVTTAAPNERGATAIRIMVGTRDLNPAGSPYDVADSREPNGQLVSIERSGLVAAGKHAVTVQWCVLGQFGSATGWHLSVETAPLQ